MVAGGFFRRDLLLRRDGVSLTAAILATGLLSSVAISIMTYLSSANKEMLNQQVASRFKFLERTLDKVIREPTLCTNALQGERWTAGADLAIDVPGIPASQPPSRPLRVGEPRGNGPNSPWELYLPGLNVEKIRVVSESTVDAVARTHTGILTVSVAADPGSNNGSAGLKNKALRFQLNFVDGVGASAGRIANCYGTSLNLGVCTNPGEFLRGFDASGNLLCGTPMDIVMNMKCDGGFYLYGYDFRNNQPHCKRLDNVPEVTGSPCPIAGTFIKGFDSLGNPKCRP